MQFLRQLKQVVSLPCFYEVEVTKVGGGTLVCCGEDIELIEE